MTDGLEKYEALASFFLSGADCDPKCKVMDAQSGCNCARTCDAITELVAMVRGLRIEIDALDDLANELEKRSEAAEQELAELKRKLAAPDPSRVDSLGRDG